MTILPHPGAIGVFDSGVGGLSVAAEIARLLPAEDMVYVADNARAPYGPRSGTEIRRFSRQITAALLGAGARLIVVACNTATSWAIDELRALHPGVSFVGLEPAVKPAATGGRVGVLATAATLKSGRYASLKKRYLGEGRVLEDDCVGLVKLIEEHPADHPDIRDRLEEILRPMLVDGIDTLVLGCTHYPLVKERIAEISGPGVTILDPAPAAARQAKRLLDKNGASGVHDVSITAALTTGGALARRIAPRPLLDTSTAAPAPAPKDDTTNPSDVSSTQHHFYTTGGAGSLQRVLLASPMLNTGRKWVIPNVEIS